ncbi:MAG: GSCFA domain-containing protein [Tannerellaceae bacterium]|jgi:hypothetical protein|nr:GSCFA domain-containing protein [Tannerellaceae bacterium]
MEWNTPVSIPEATSPFSCRDRIMILGSCFAREIGDRLSGDKFDVDVNPFGTLYNPASVALSLSRLLEPSPFVASDLFEHEGVYHSFMHHSSFSSVSENEALENVNRQLKLSSYNLTTASRLIITFGTAYLYRRKIDGRTVSNCHKLPERLFERERLTVDAIISEWDGLLHSLQNVNPALKILFTVSPVRHWKDGAHNNRLSKAILLMAIDALQTRYPERIAYFPAYEIMMDELRDYRFYADDMLHPSTLAVEYICERFYRSFLSSESQALINEWKAIKKALEHKPFQPASPSYRQFMQQTLSKAEYLYGKFPYFNLSQEIKRLRSILK